MLRGGSGSSPEEEKKKGENPSSCAELRPFATMQTTPKTEPSASRVWNMKTNTSSGTSNIFKSQTLQLNIIFLSENDQRVSGTFMWNLYTLVWGLCLKALSLYSFV